MVEYLIFNKKYFKHVKYKCVLSIFKNLKERKVFF